MKNLALTSVILIIFTSGGYFAGKSTNQNIKLIQEKQETTPPTDLEAKVHLLTDVDLKEYSNLKSQREKYNKANEILQKILKLFLLDLGLRISDSNYDLLKQNFDEPIKNNVDNSVIAGLDRNSSDEEIIATVKKNLKAQVGSPEWTAKESKITDISNDEDAKAFLKSVEIKDFFKSLKSLKPISKKQFDTISGTFVGKANVFVKNKNQVWDVEIEITDTSEGDKLSAETLIRMFNEKGKRFSKSTGDGQLTNFKRLNGSKLAIIVNTYGGSGFFQLYEADRMNVLIGNYYHEQSVGEFKKAGTVRLERR